MKQKIIGGKFGLPKEFSKPNISPSFLEGQPILLFNARSAIKIILDSLKASTIWVPSYLCPTILTAINTHKTKLRYYPIDENLNVSSLSFLDQVIAGDLFLFIDYFGFPFENKLLQKLKEKGVILIQDGSQA